MAAAFHEARYAWIVGAPYQKIQPYLCDGATCIAQPSPRQKLYKAPHESPPRQLSTSRCRAGTYRIFALEVAAMLLPPPF